MRRAARKDNNHNEISKELESIGCSVADTSQLGQGFPDIVVGYKGYNFLFEIKRDDIPPSQSKLTADEIKFFDKWRGQIDVIRNANDAKVIIFKLVQPF